MNERQLEYFLAVLSCGTFSGAAEEVGVSQSAVSQAISALEVRVGAPLFERSHGGVRPTPAGREFQGHAERAQAAMAEAVASVAMVQHLAGGSLEVACPASLAIDPVAPLVAAFRREFPGVTIRLRDLPERDVDEELLFSIGADIAITFEERADGGMQITPIGSIEVVAVLPRPAASTVTVADVLDRGLVTTPRGTAPRLLLENRVDSEAIEASIVVEAIHPDAVLPLVLNGAGAALVSTGRAIIAASMPGIEVRRIDPPALLDVVVALPRASRSAVAEQFVRVCREEATKDAAASARSS